MSKLVLDAINARLDALETAVLGHTRRRETRAQRARRKGVSTRTIARRVANGTEDQPDLIDGRWYFWVDEPERGTPDTAEARAARNPQRHKAAHPEGAP
jgi:hypothetical protein